MKPRNTATSYFNRDWEKLAVRMVNETYVNYDAKWVKFLINHPFSSWGGRSSLEVIIPTILILNKRGSIIY